MRNAENQVVPEEPRLLSENNSGPVSHGETARHSSHNELPHTELSNQPYTLNFSFEELNTLGLDEGAPRHSNLSWQVFIVIFILRPKRFNSLRLYCYIYIIIQKTI